MANDRGRRFWEKLVGEVEAGGSLTAVAGRHGVSASWLRKWCSRVRAETSTGTLLPVRVIGDRVRRVELVVGGARLSFEEGTDPQYIAQIAQALGS